jgi:hypothetical protein
MNYLGTSISYILNRFFFRVYYFLYHWYIRGFRKFFNWVLNYLEKLDYKFALRINLKNIFQPLYQDYSFFGYILGFIMRSFRILIAIFIYGLFIIFCSFLFILWALVPVFLIYQIVVNFPN